MTFLAKTKGCLSCTLTEKTWIKIRRPCSARPFSDSTQVLWHILLSPAAPGKTSKSLVLCTYEWKMEIKRPHHRLPDFLLHDLQDVPGKTFITVLSCALIEKMDAKSQEASCTDSAAKASPPMSGSWQHLNARQISTKSYKVRTAATSSQPSGPHAGPWQKQRRNPHTHTHFNQTIWPSRLKIGLGCTTHLTKTLYRWRKKNPWHGAWKSGGRLLSCQLGSCKV